MIFMIAEHLFEWADLSREANETIDEIASLPLPNWLQVRVQLHTSNDVKRYAIGPNGKQPETCPEGERDLTQGKALGDFISWALHSAGHAKEDNSMLVMWGHAYPFGIGFRDTGTGVDALDFAELSKVLKNIQDNLKKQFPDNQEMKLELLGFDACDLATIELAAHFSPYAKYLVASQVPIPLPGWPYGKILGQLIASRDDNRVPMEPSQFGSYIVRTFCGNYNGKDDAVSLSLLSLQQAQPIYDQSQELAERLLLALDGDTAETDLVARLFDLSQTYRDKPFVDAADLCENLVRYCNDSSVRHAAGDLGDLLTIPAHSGAAKDEHQPHPFVLECGRNGHDTVKLHGVSLYAPNVAIDSHDWRKASYWYAKFHGGSKNWCSLVEALSQRGS
jgi:hypothetical protein